MSKRFRILMLTQLFDPEPTFKGLVFARELVRQGFDVEVVTGFPNYPGGKVYPDYKIKWLQRELIDGVHVTRVPLYPNHNQSAIKRVVNYLSFSASALIYGLFFAKRADVIYAYHPPLTVGVASTLIRLFRRIPVVYDIQDIWPDTLRATGMINSTSALSVVGLVCKWVYRRVDQLTVLSPGFKRLLVQRGVPEGKIKVIHNWADESSLTVPKGTLPSNFPGKDRFRILFAGNIGKAQALEVVLEAAKKLKLLAPHVCFILLGGGVEVTRLRTQASMMQLDNVLFYEPVLMAEVGTYLNAADVLLVHLRKDPLFEITVPSKTQAYMAAGKPLLMAVEGDAAMLVQKADCGRVAKPEDAESLAQVAADLSRMNEAELDALAENGKRYYQTHLSLQVGVRHFTETFAWVMAK